MRANRSMTILFQRISRFSHGGFTFLEVMVAVAIIAIAFVSLIGSQSRSVSIAAESRFNVMAALLARQKLTEIESAYFDSVMSDEGDFGGNVPGYRWRTKVRELTKVDTGLTGVDEMLKAVDLTITQGDDERFLYYVQAVVMGKINAVQP